VSVAPSGRTWKVTAAAVNLAALTFLDRGAELAAQAPKPSRPAASASAPKARGPSFAELAQRASAARDANRIEEAIDLYRQATRIRPTWDEGWWYIGTLLYERDRFEEARAAFLQFLELKPDVGPAWALRGFCEYRLEDYPSALEHIAKGLRLGLGGSAEILRHARFHEALLYVKAGQFELAVTPLTLLARSETESLGLVEPIGLMMLRVPQLPSEMSEERREQVRRTGHAGYLFLARKGPEAQAAFEELLKTYPKQPYLHYAYGVFLLKGEPDRGLEKLQREIEIEPENVFAHLAIAYEHLRREDAAAARTPAERAVILAPGLFAARHALGRALVESGEVERGIVELETAARLAPESPEVFFALARAYGRAGRKEQAEGARARFTELDRKRRELRGESGAGAESEQADASGGSR